MCRQLFAILSIILFTANSKYIGASYMSLQLEDEELQGFESYYIGNSYMSTNELEDEQLEMGLESYYIGASYMSLNLEDEQIAEQALESYYFGASYMSLDLEDEQGFETPYIGASYMSLDLADEQLTEQGLETPYIGASYMSNSALGDEEIDSILKQDDLEDVESITEEEETFATQQDAIENEEDSSWMYIAGGSLVLFSVFGLAKIGHNQYKKNKQTEVEYERIQESDSEYTLQGQTYTFNTP